MTNAADIERDLLHALDPAAFMAATVGTPDEWQAGVLRSDARRLILLCSRQSGKSAVSATKGMHTALYKPGSLTLMLSPSLRQSREIFGKAMAVYRATGRAVASEIENRLELELSNGSRIVALPGTEASIRGFSNVDLLIIDEAARVPDELYAAVRPFLAVSGGQLFLLSTGWGKRGFYHETWTDGRNWERVRIPASECPRISPEFLEEERRALPAWFYDQEYECQFRDTVDQLFGTDLITAALSDDVEPLFPSTNDDDEHAGVEPLFMEAKHG